MFKKTSEERHCAFCKLPHRVYMKKEVSVFDALLILAVTGLMAYAIWGGPDLRSMLIFMGLSFVTQVFLRVRYRESVKCPHCGFDPILYNHDNEAAAQKVKTFMETRTDNPEYMLKPQPQIPVIYKTREEMEEEQMALNEAQEEAPALPEEPSRPTDLQF